MNHTGTDLRNTSPQGDVRLLNKLLLAQGEGCFYCDRHISLRKFFSSLRYGTVDHFIPLALGGRDHISNIVLACGQCNHKKGSRFPTLLEVAKWNSLAQNWPHIRPLDPRVHIPRKPCVSCGGPIPIDRLLVSMESASETNVCSLSCKAAEKTRRRTTDRERGSEHRTL
jgi:predicted nucleic acid-binding Zn ribbon protein